MSPLIVPLDSPEATEAAQTGGKGANLARLIQLGLPVPAGFVVPTDAYRAVVAANGLAGAPPEQLRDRLPAVDMPDDLASAIDTAYADLGRPDVAVRSSATSEDLAEASFAGQHDTFLDVRGRSAVLDAVRSCWASLWSIRAVDYRRQRGWTDDIAIAVVVQEMVAAEWAGVLFTVDPVTANPARMLIEGVAGLGETLVSGSATGARVVVDKASLLTVNADATIPTSIVREVARLGREVEAAFGGPQDIEWAHEDGRTYLVQARPMTALPATPQRAARFGRLQRAMAPSVREHVPVAPYPFDLSIFFRPLWERLFTALPRLGLRTPPIDAVFTEIADGVVQVVPPAIRPTPRIVGPPIAIARSLRADPTAWLARARILATDARNLDAASIAAMSDDELVARIHGLAGRQLDLATSRFAAFPRGLIATGVLGFVVRRAVGRDASSVERDLLAAIPCVTTAANRKLERIASSIREDADHRALFLREPPDRLVGALDAETRAAVDAFLDQYGDRETTIPSAAFPTWREDPVLIIGLLKALVSGPERTGAEDDEARQAHAQEEVRRRLGRGWLGLKGFLFIPLFARALPSARAFIAFREDSHYLLFAPFGTIRRTALELGRRLTERGILGAPEDVFFLRLAELERGKGLPDVVDRRRAARASVEGTYTTVPAELLVADGPDLRGTPVSGGQAVGAARIILGEADFWKLAPGEILVAPYTNPTWTPLFALAAGVVVEAGGAASHAAIVAREYGIPGVMGVADATARLHDGDQVLVDGTRGNVAIIPTPMPTPSGAV